jgi:hypothetical protein
MSSFAFVVTSIFSDSGREAVEVLRGYIAHRLISFGIQFLLVSRVLLSRLMTSQKAPAIAGLD